MKNPFTRLFRARDKPGATDSVSSAPTFYFGSSAAGKSVTANTVALPAAAQCESPGVPSNQLRRRLDLIKPSDR